MHEGKRLALLVNDVFGAYQAAFRAAIEREANRNGCSLLVFNGRSLAHPDPSERAQNGLYDWVSPAVAEGAIVLSGTVAHFADREAMSRLCAGLGTMPVVSIGLEIPGFPCVLVENRAGLTTVVQHVIRQHGRRRVAYIGGPRGNEETSQRLAGYKDALEANGIAFDPALVVDGLFTLPSGVQAMRDLLARGVPFDAVVAANDQMAMGAMDLLRARKVRVPEEVVVTGFDDTPVAQFAARSLTTFAQPIDRMGEASVTTVLAHINGGAAPTQAFEGHLVLRESCGCGYVLRRSAYSTHSPRQDVVEYLRERRETLVAEVCPGGESTSAVWRTRWAPALLDALIADLGGVAGAFIRQIEATTDEARERQASLAEIADFVIALQRLLDHAGYRGSGQFELEQLWVQARTMVSTTISRAQARAALSQIEGSVDLRYLTQRLSVAFDAETLAAEFERTLPQLGVETAYVGLRVKGDAEHLRPLLTLEGGARLGSPGAAYPLTQLLPDGYPKDPSQSLLLWAITFENELLGLIALGGSADPSLGEAIRAQIGAALRMGELHARVVEQTALEQRMAREHLAHEMETAKRIQTALVPIDLRVPGLEMGAAMLAADAVGGDYYEVLPVPGGCWLGIGDVAGHGLMSGLIALMIQSTVSALIHARPDDAPARLVSDVNRVLVSNLHDRLRSRKHATFSLLRYFDDGRLVFAGAHEPMIVWRKQTQACEIVETEGTWLGLVADITAVTVDREIRLEPGDLLVLLTDGLCEARNAHGKTLGLDAIVRIVQAHAEAAPEAIVLALTAAVRSWAPILQDDVTCVVARRVMRSPPPPT